ncbi:right-handed parallel beta-helix repeat-containing protein [Smaragdicoccus niigatensis]|uniref:right-handed parallel beta-helix repeat-containing protein n=1 Tax=Smaragdicoccus niigatensis TaxID=359359 RepID=UPI00036CAD89|nr:right-handed parallel beta-helix repeat-containing protein [Smaragdicoccus niigatensis]
MDSPSSRKLDLLTLHHQDPVHAGLNLSRRSLLAAVPAVAALAAFTPRAGAAGTTIDASKYPSLQAAIDAAPDGATITAPLSFQTLGDAKLDSRNGIQLTGLSISGRLTLNYCTNVTISNCRIVTPDIGIWMVRCTTCTVSSCTLSGCTLGGYSPSGCVFTKNTITNASGNAISFAGYDAAPALNNKYTANVIQNCGRIGIEEYPTEGTDSCRGTVIDGNRITTATSMGISAVGMNPTITNNTIQNAGWTGIEVLGNYAYISGNNISSTNYSGAGICVNSTDPSFPDAKTTVTGNTLTGLGTGITLIAQKQEAPLRNVTVSSNTLTNCADFGIIGLNGYEAGGNQINSNTFSLTAPTQANRNRIALKTGNNISLSGNKITYKPNSAGVSVDMPIHLVGNNVKLSNTVVDGGWRTKNLLPSASVAPAGSYTGWQYINNRYINGAKINKLGTVATVDSDRNW